MQIVGHGMYGMQESYGIPMACRSRKIRIFVILYFYFSGKGKHHVCCSDVTRGVLCVCVCGGTGRQKLTLRHCW